MSLYVKPHPSVILAGKISLTPTRRKAVFISSSPRYIDLIALSSCASVGFQLLHLHLLSHSRWKIAELHIRTARQKAEIATYIDDTGLGERSVHGLVGSGIFSTCSSCIRGIMLREMFFNSFGGCRRSAVFHKKLLSPPWEMFPNPGVYEKMIIRNGKRVCG